MKALELRIPPPAVALLLAGWMWAVAPLGYVLPLSAVVRLSAAAVLALAGLGFDVAGYLAFRRARTTINPLKPEKSSALVSGGIYRITRNPMYVGMALVLAGWAVYLGSAWGLAGPALFVLYIQRFQIVPEERILAGIFPEEFAAYAAQVRRWL